MALRAGLVLALLLGILHGTCWAHTVNCMAWLGVNVSLEPGFLEPAWNFSAPTILEITPDLMDRLPVDGRLATLEHIRKNYNKGLKAKNFFRLAVWPPGLSQKRLVTYELKYEPERTRIQIVSVEPISAEACSRFWRRLAEQRETEGFELKPTKPININDEFYFHTLHVSPSVVLKLKLGHRFTRKLIDDVMDRLTVFRPADQSTLVAFVKSRGRRFKVVATMQDGELYLKTIHVIHSFRTVDAVGITEPLVTPN